MKRDARIGLAVVLVLGLSVTLLIGRALYRNPDPAGIQPDDGIEFSSAPADGGEALRVDGAAMPGATQASAPVQQPLSLDSARAETVELPVETSNAAVREFIDNQTRPLGAVAIPAQTPVAQAPLETASRPGMQPVRPTAGGPEIDESLLEDHESPTLVRPDADAVPKDGYGYVVLPGDNIWKISSKVYGDGKFTQKIVAVNKGVNTSRLKPGMVIKIPIIQNKTVLMKLPSFADAVNRKAGGGSALAAAEPRRRDSQPVAAQRLVRAETGEAGSAVPATHKVESGETLGMIAKKYYGYSGPKTIAKIIAANKGLDPARLKIGQEIALPPKN